MVLLVAAALALPAGCKKKKKSEPEGETPTATAPGDGIAHKRKRAEPPKEIVKGTYPNTVNGLRDMMADLVRAHRRDEAGARSRAEAVLALPGAAAWFNERFGAEIGKHLLREYEVYGHGFAEFPRLITDQGTKYGRKTFVVDMISAATDEKATGFQARAIEAMKKKQPLFTFRLRGAGKPDFVLYSFVHDGVSFRYVGRLARFNGKLPNDHKTLEKTVGEIAAAKPAAP